MVMTDRHRGLWMRRVLTAAVVAGAVAAAPGMRGLCSGTVQAQAPKRVLLLTHNTFYNHSNLQAIEDVLPGWGNAAGFAVTSLEGYKQTVACTTQKPCEPNVADLSMITRKYLSQFDAIVASTNGELPFTDEGKQALVDFVRKDGKGIVFLHQSMVTLFGFKPWGELLGAYGPSVIFEVEDRGVGIAAEDVPHVTRRFFRGRGAATGGSGLGLAIAQRIVTDHGGILRVTSTQGAGTTVSVTLPVATAS